MSFVSSDRLQALPSPHIPDTDEAVLGPADQVPVAMELQASDRAIVMHERPMVDFLFHVINVNGFIFAPSDYKAAVDSHR